MVRIILGIIWITTINCSCKREAGAKVTNKEILNLKNKVTSDSCSFCSIDSFLIKPSLVSVKPDLVIDHPIAIEFFNRAELIFKYETENYDTLMKVFKMKNWNDRNEINRAYRSVWILHTSIKTPAAEKGNKNNRLASRPTIDIFYR